MIFPVTNMFLEYEMNIPKTESSIGVGKDEIQG